MARVLVVDDDRIVLSLVQHRLERSGHEVVGVSSPQRLRPAIENLIKGVDVVG